ncbi:hypothetical protein TNCV_1127001 [Trichonephila clavipes]|nr:hypothetical protein TNCV_1127001 [Trichonephila clavipes]
MVRRRRAKGKGSGRHHETCVISVKKLDDTKGVLKSFMKEEQRKTNRKSSRKYISSGSPVRAITSSRRVLVLYTPEAAAIIGSDDDKKLII